MSHGEVVDTLGRHRIPVSIQRAARIGRNLRSHAGGPQQSPSPCCAMRPVLLLGDPPSAAPAENKAAVQTAAEELNQARLTMIIPQPRAAAENGWPHHRNG
ncbi:hypothetical protein Jann_1831 [Jannaschia sp. CCS1]|nr:hypothetical protein Jann_1831 [Jannaschia sp. CCS1]